MRLAQSGEGDDRGFGMFAARPVGAGTPLVSIPLSLAILSSADERRAGSFSGAATPQEELLQLLARGLMDPSSEHHAYCAFLHDAHNAGADEEVAALLGSVDAPLFFSPRDSRAAATAMRVEALIDGGALNMAGVRNAPFIERHELPRDATPAARAEWVRARRAVRQAQQALPHFAARAAAWALSMAMSRSVVAPDGELALLPVIDFCNHAGTPSAHIVMADAASPLGVALGQAGKAHRFGGQPRSQSTVWAHVVALRDITGGEEVTVQYADMPVVGNELAWGLRYGFVPSEEPSSTQRDLDGRARTAALNRCR